MAPHLVPGVVAGWLAELPGTVRVAVDGAPAASPETYADSLIEPLRALGRPAVHVPTGAFLRDASLRWEHGREDVEAYSSWLDEDALRREVLVPALERGCYLPSLRDPVTNRSTRELARPLAPGTVLLVSGGLLLGRDLPFDRTIHLTLSPAARARRTPADQAWTLAAFDRYERTARPAATADVAVKLDDPRHPAMRGPA